MRWAIQVDRTGLDHRNLFDLVRTVGYERVDVSGYEIAFSSASLQTCTNATEVWEEAKKLRKLITNVTEIDPDFVLGGVIEMASGAPRKHGFAEVQSCIMAVTASVATLTLSTPEGLSAEQFAEWEARKAEQEYQDRLEAQRAKLEPAFREPRAVKVLTLLKLDEHTGESLNKIYELAEGHPSDRKAFQATFGIDENEFKRFSDAVHNPVVSGEKARHAYDQTPKTSNPMSMAEAESFVTEIAGRWLASLRN